MRRPTTRLGGHFASASQARNYAGATKYTKPSSRPDQDQSYQVFHSLFDDFLIAGGSNANARVVSGKTTHNLCANYSI
jgi:hypothetical protein